MASERYDLIFRGDILLDQSLEEVKLRLQKLLKADPGQVERLFSGRPVALKRGLDPEAAQKYRRVLEQAGARARLVPSAPAKTGTGPARRAKASGGEPTSQPGRAQPGSGASSGLSLAPLEGPLLKPGERPSRPPVVVNIEGLSLRPVGGDLLDPAERPNPEAVDQPVPDYGLSAPGSDLLTPGERPHQSPVELDLEDWGLAELGEDLLREPERAKAPPAPVLSGGLSLAPAGTELEGLPREPVPGPPDTRGLSLSD